MKQVWQRPMAPHGHKVCSVGDIKPPIARDEVLHAAKGVEPADSKVRWGRQHSVDTCWTRHRQSSLLSREVFMSTCVFQASRQIVALSYYVTQRQVWRVTLLQGVLALLQLHAGSPTCIESHRCMPRSARLRTPTCSA